MAFRAERESVHIKCLSFRLFNSEVACEIAMFSAEKTDEYSGRRDVLIIVSVVVML